MVVSLARNLSLSSHSETWPSRVALPELNSATLLRRCMTELKELPPTLPTSASTTTRDRAIAWFGQLRSCASLPHFILCSSG